MSISVNEVTPKSAAFLSNAAITITHEIAEAIDFHFHARNGFFIQRSILRLIDNKWLIATRLSKTLPNGSSEVIYTEVDPEFPLKEGRVEWNW